MTGHGVVDGTVGINGLSAAAVAIPTGATAGYGDPDVTQYGARVTHPAAAAGHFGSSVGPYGVGVGGPSLRDQCQVNGMLNLVGLGAAAAAAAQHPGQHHNQLQGQSSGGGGGGGGNGGGVQPNLNHPVQQQQQSNVPTYKWMQVKRNVPKPGTFPFNCYIYSSFISLGLIVFLFFDAINFDSRPIEIRLAVCKEPDGEIKELKK